MRPFGHNAERYQELISGWHDIVRTADRLGVWGVATVEHHFHFEGYEVGPNPGVMDAYWAAINKNVRLGALGYGMSVQNPIRVAEETATLDSLSGGRTFVGFARGYQSRWTNILGQHLGPKATLSPSGSPEEKMAALTEEQRATRFADDQNNREVFEEQVDLVLRAWAEDSIDSKGRWEIPYPYKEGIDWTMTATREIGAPGEMDADRSMGDRQGRRGLRSIPRAMEQTARRVCRPQLRLCPAARAKCHRESRDVHGACEASTGRGHLVLRVIGRP